MKVVWLTNVPSPYRVDFFNELGKNCDLTVLFERAASSERNQKWQSEQFINFRGIILEGIKVGVDQAFCSTVISWLHKNKYDIIVISNPLAPTGMLAIELLRLKKIPFIIEIDGGFAKSGIGLKESVKRHFIKSAQYWFSSGETPTEYLLTYGAQKNKILVYPFTSVREKDVLANVPSFSEKKQLKLKLGITEDNAIVCVGQFIHRKGVDVLLRAAKYLSSSCGIYIIGGQPNHEYLAIVKEFDLKNVHFIEFKSKNELKDYYKACDLFVLPTREDIWGLVVNEAMAFGLPIITTDKCIAGLELVDDENGKIIPVNDVDSLVNAVNRILSDDVIMKSMSEISLQKIRTYTIENMAEVHLKYFRDMFPRSKSNATKS